MTASQIEPILTQLEAALAARDTQRSWQLISPLTAARTSDARVANVWLTMLRITPARESLVSEVTEILEHWPNDNALQLLGCDALIRAAELVAPDVPVNEAGAAVKATEVAERNLSRLTAAEQADRSIGGYWLMNQANALRLAHRYPEAEVAYDKALALDPKNGDWWFNFGLLHKAQGDFARALAATQKAAESLRDRRGVLWNIALCATALGQGTVAADAMRALGFNARVLESGMPYVEGLPPVQVRVATLGSGHGYAGPELDQSVLFELVWVSPASPFHGVVQTPTFRDGSVDYGDLVLWDGTPIGMTELDGKATPRFALLSKLRDGGERRFRFVALEQDEGDVARCAAELPEPVRMFMQRAHVEMLCPRCASGDHMHKHTHLAAEPHRLVYGKLIVPAEIELRGFQTDFNAYVRQHPKVQFVIPGLHEALGDTQGAGKAHQLWRGLERTSEKRDAAFKARLS
ncbi:MAG TPA: tetratricopeptide repeat protein [Polyangiales bacterium]|nr:tetratricopeptide repeat protein [Polyangiales bacterium]